MHVFKHHFPCCFVKGFNAKLYNIQPKRAMLELKKDRITAWKEEYEKEGATPTNMRYGYVAGPVDHSLFA